MSTFSLRSVSPAEQTAIRGQLGQLGLKLDRTSRELDTAALSGTALDPAALEAAAKAQGRPGELDLALVKKLIQAAHPPSAADQQQMIAARAGQQNLVQRTDTVADELFALSTGAALPSKAELGKLEARTTKIKQELDSLWLDEQRLRWLEPSEIAAIGSSASSLVKALAAFQERASTLVLGEATPPLPTYAQLLSTLNRNGLDIGAWAGHFLGDAAYFPQASAACRQDHLALFGLDPATFDAHFEVVRSEGYTRSEPAIRTTKPIDLDLSGRGLSSIGYADWLEHKGDLNLAGNELEGTWALPQLIHGSLSLADNAFQDLGSAFGEPIRIEGDLDLSNNKNLSSLESFTKIEVGGDVSLVGIPATYLPAELSEHLVFGGKLILHASQHGLIDSAQDQGYPVVVVGEDHPAPPFVLPADPAAMLKDVEATSLLEPSQLRQLIGAVDYHERLAIADGLIPEARGEGEHAAKAYALLCRLSHAAAIAVFAEEAKLIPVDPEAPIPPALLALPTWKLQALANPVSELDHEFDAAHTKPSFQYPPAPHFATPRATRLLDLLLDRARQGAPITQSVYVLDGADRCRAALEIIAHQVESVREDKGLSWVKVKGAAGERQASELWSGLPEQVLSDPKEMARIAQRLPKNKAFARLLETQARHLDLLGLAIIREQLTVLADPSPALASALAAVRGLTQASTLKEAQAAVSSIRAQLSALNDIERGALLQEVDSQDVLVLAKGGEGRVRLELAGLGLELLAGLEGDRQSRAATRVAELAVELLYQHPAIGAQAEAHANAVFDALQGSTLGDTLVRLNWALAPHPRGKAVLERQLDRLVATATEPESIYAMAATRYSQVIMPRKDALLAKLMGLPAQGDLGAAVARVLERLGA